MTNIGGSVAIINVPVAGLSLANTTANVRVNSTEANNYVIRDARSRALRTVAVGLGIDVATALLLVLIPLVSNIEWTNTYWIALASLAAKSVVQAMVSYFFRLIVKPKVGVQV
jgi:hypothetical protein